MPVPLLTKSRYKLASECPRKLWYQARPAEYPNTKHDDEFLQALADGGHQIDALARCLFPHGELVETLNTEAALAQTANLLRRDEVVIFEAAFQSGPFLVRVDILRKTRAGYELMEVKAKSWDPATDTLNTKDGTVRAARVEILEDVAFQTWVIRQVFPGQAVVPYLLLVNKATITEADGLHQLFRLEHDAAHRVTVRVVDPQEAMRIGQDMLAKIPVAAEVERLINGTAGITAESDGAGASLPERARHFAQVQQASSPIAAPIGMQCKTCEFRCTAADATHGMRDGFGECWAERLGAAYRSDRLPVFSLWYLSEKKFLEWTDQNYWFLDQVPQSQAPDKHPRQIRQWEAVVNRSTGEYLDPAIPLEIESWRYPIHFLDFETITPAIPFHRGMHPYEVVPFQFSCHHLHADGRITHDEFLDMSPGAFPTWRFLEALKRSVGHDDGAILRYTAHENSVLRAVRRQIVRAQRAPASAPAPFPAGMEPDAYVAWIDTITTPTRGEGTGLPAGTRSMIDLFPLVKNHYFHPNMRGSNSIKALLPAVLSASDRLREHYQQPLQFGTHLIGNIMWQMNQEHGSPHDPYALLPPVFSDLSLDEADDKDEASKLASGGAAMMAYAHMQYADVPLVEREAYGQALLRYCELDTLAMVMIVEHWRSAEPSS